jgi:hypothetical protein
MKHLENTNLQILESALKSIILNPFRYILTFSSRNWRKQEAESKKTGKEPSFLKAAFDTFGWQYLGYGLVYLFCEVVVRYLHMKTHNVLK